MATSLAPLPAGYSYTRSDKECVICLDTMKGQDVVAHEDPKSWLPTWLRWKKEAENGKKHPMHFECIQQLADKTHYCFCTMALKPFSKNNENPPPVEERAPQGEFRLVELVESFSLGALGGGIATFCITPPLNVVTLVGLAEGVLNGVVSDGRFFSLHTFKSLVEGGVIAAMFGRQDFYHYLITSGMGFAAAVNKRSSYLITGIMLGALWYYNKDSWTHRPLEQVVEVLSSGGLTMWVPILKKMWERRGI